MFGFSSKFRKGFVYDSVKEDIENLFMNRYCCDDDTTIDECINDILDRRWDEILEDEDYEDISENKLWNLFIKNLENDIDENSLIEAVTPDDSYHGLSARLRNPFLR